MKKANFRKMETSTGKLILAGRNDKSNEALVNNYIGKSNIILHTAKPGSPFCFIDGKPSKADIKEAAVFCVKYSQAWKKASKKTDVEVHYFLGKNIFKERGMKLGTFGVKKFKKIIIKKEEIEKCQ